MRLYRTEQGWVRQEGTEFIALDVANQGLEHYLSDLRVFDRAGGERHSELPSTNLPLLDHPGKFIIAGMNYHDHCQEIGVEPPEKLLFGSAPGSAINSANNPVQIQGEETDYEGEVGVIIAKPTDSVAAQNAWQHIAGITSLNDVSARDVQAARTPEAVSQAKGFPGFKPMGPCFATPDEFSNINALPIKTYVNGELRQDSNTSKMIFDIAAIVETVSSRLALQAGDVICTGTPGGVAHGGKYPYLTPGDEVQIVVADLPPLINTFVS